MHARTRENGPRRKQRGSVVVEALVVIMVLLVCFFGVAYGYRVYSPQLDAVYDARLAAWEATMSGCNQAPLDPLTVVLGLATNAPPSARVELAIELLGYNHVRVESAEAEVPGLAPFYDGARSVLVRTQMPCNEEPHDLGTRRSALEWGRELLPHLFP